MPIISNDQFLISTLAIDSQPVNANECNSIQKLDYPAIPNSIPAKYLIVFQMKNGLYYKWTYLNAGDRDNEFLSVQATVTTTILNYDPDALTFITATGISGVDAAAINQLVLDLKAYFLWTDFIAVYPIIGGNALSHSYNLLDTTTFQLNFNGAWTHAPTGMTPDGATAYANTGIVPSIEMNPVANNINFYSRTDANGLYADMASFTTVPGSRVELMTRMAGSLEYSINNTAPDSIATADSLGMYTITRSAPNLIKANKNGALIANSGVAVAGTQSVQPIYIGARNIDGVADAFSVRECAFAAIGNTYLNFTKVTNLYNSVQAYQTTLGRNV